MARVSLGGVGKQPARQVLPVDEGRQAAAREETAAWNAIALAIAGVACVVLVATTAAALPGWRASRVEPLAALRQE